MDSLLGITYGDWKALLTEEGNVVEKEYKKRKRLLTLFSLLNSRYKKKEEDRFGHKIESAEIKAPIFILGHWRSGTTLLHNILCKDEQFGFPNKFQISHPHSFLIREAAVQKAMKNAAAQKRHMDNVEVSYDSPDEDETAISMMSQRSPIIGWAFTKNQRKYAKYHTFDEVDQNDLERWKRAMITFYKKLSFRYDRPLVLKSPVHLGRMKIFHELFPDARFIHIYRDPYRVYQSTKKLYTTVLPHTCFQEPILADWEDYIIENYKTMYDRFWHDRAVIPAAQVYEIKYEEFEKDIYRNTAAIYEYFNLHGFFKFEPLLKRYTESIANYQKNKFESLAERELIRINSAWHQSFEKGRYDKIEPSKEMKASAS